MTTSSPSRNHLRLPIRMASETALFTDRYELTMLEAALHSGIASRHATFEIFGRGLAGRAYGVIAGTARIASLLNRFTFSDEDLDYLGHNSICSADTLAYLAKFRFSGSIYAYPDGELYFPFSPVLRLEATFAEGLILETLLLSALNFDSAIATAASRMVLAARGRSLIEMGTRRTNEDAAVAAARASYIAGFQATSNLAAGQRHAIPTAGTMGHAIILAHESEAAAFRAQRAVAGDATTALVDTYDTMNGIRTAIATFGPSLAAIRIDSGDPGETSRAARELLDSLAATKTQIIVSGDLDEAAILSLKDAPIDGFGIGTKLVTGSGVPTAGFVYKLVAIERGGERIPVAKQSEDKTSDGGAKTAYRRTRNRRAIDEFSLDPGASITSTSADELRQLQLPVIVQGEVVIDDDLERWRRLHQESLLELGSSEDLLSTKTPLLQCHYIGPGTLRS
ncbi:nicotinate phosphoribosyltransferase pncB1 [Ferrimicrobium acidiphilum DSM 19497]|uniref:Nicotinate phosphoribosyltransferase n=2 Tax=Ferrimicrobium acidiphilum TaxID=121039 RepID=A0A0D8FYM0_9ACTN|nr:nicotinate phosphoribosyltransferase pncB1 [Ferrimicrobium acidiphilum DSM 19497]